MLEPNTDFVISIAEWNILQDQPHNLRTLYFSFRRLMDFDTGIVGIKYKLTMQYMIESLTVCAQGPRKRYSPPSKNIIRLIFQLESLGLIENLDASDQKIGSYKMRLILARMNRMSKGATRERLGSDKGDFIHRKDSSVSYCNKKVTRKLSTGYPPALGSDKGATRERLGSALILDTELQNYRITELSLSPSEPTEAMLPLPAPSTPERESLFFVEDEDAKSARVIEYLAKRTGRDFRLVEVHLKFIRLALQKGISEEECKAIVDLRVEECARPGAEKYKPTIHPENLFASEYTQAYLTRIIRPKPIPKPLDTACRYHDSNETEASRKLCTGTAPEGLEAHYRNIYGQVVCQWHADVIMAARNDSAAQRRVDSLLESCNVGFNGDTIPRFSAIFKRI